MNSKNFLSNYWDNEMSELQKQNFIRKNHFWIGLAAFKYKYIPEDVRKKLWFKTSKNE
ncbi:MAG: hypothetical protein ACOC22_00110 [bacterium]